jgi:hypothetical protein
VYNLPTPSLSVEPIRVLYSIRRAALGVEEQTAEPQLRSEESKMSVLMHDVSPTGTSSTGSIYTWSTNVSS